MQETLYKTTVRMCVQITLFKRTILQGHRQHLSDLSPRTTEGLTHREFTSSKRYLPYWRSLVVGCGFKVFIIMHYFNGLQQKEITVYKKSNIKTALNYINVKSKMCAVTKGA